METPLSIVAVFTASEMGFTGNTAAVLYTSKPMPEDRMRQLAADLNQPATTFLSATSSPTAFEVRWLAPDGEIGLCGHGSLAAIAYLSKNHGLKAATLKYGQGELLAKHNEGNSCSIDLESILTTGTETPSPILEAGLGTKVLEYHTTNNKHVVVVESESVLRNLKPDFQRLRESPVFGYSVTALGDDCDFVSRTIIPHVKQLEDPATGSSHAALAPFWGKKLGKNKMTALQLSQRGGKFFCELKGSRVILTGEYSFIAEGQLFI